MTWRNNFNGSRAASSLLCHLSQIDELRDGNMMKLLADKAAA
jgi:hypothetical protein